MGAQKENAERVTEGYFNVMSQGPPASALALYSDSFFEQMPREKWRANLEALPSRLGEMKGHKLVNWNVNLQAGSGAYTTLVYNVTYSKFNSTETFVLFTRDSKAEPQIVGHHIESEAFLVQQ